MFIPLFLILVQFSSLAHLCFSSLLLPAWLFVITSPILKNIRLLRKTTFQQRQWEFFHRIVITVSSCHQENIVEEKNICCHHFVIASHCFLWKLKVVTLLQGMTANHHHTRSDTAVKGHFEKRKSDFSQHFSSSKDLEGVYLAHGGVCLAWRLAGRHFDWVPWDWPVAANQRVKKSNKYL